MKRRNLLLILVSILFACSTNKTKDMRMDTKSESKEWWKETIVYQIYPRSFQDSNGDGVGDLRGIIQRLDYIQSLGVDAIWLNPIYSSPNDDNGYDVSDYRNIMSDFGTMADFDEMLAGMHKRGIKLIMDIVVNHSSDEHEWFKQSRSSRENPYRNYYHWWPAEKGKPNYRYSLFDEKGEAWKYDSLTNAYYLHYFSRKQPDLNWENPKLRQEVYDIMTFWAEKGVDGFRLDAFQFVAKDTTYPPFPKGFEKDFFQYYAMQGNLHEYLREMNRKVLSKYNVMAVAEGAGRNFQDAHDLVDADRKELSMAYAFDGADIGKYGGYKLSRFKEVFTRWDSAFAEKGWLSIFLSNHDQARLVSRYGNDSPQYRDASTKMLNTFILSMRGTPYCYYGDELGMTNIYFDKIEQYNDISARNGYIKAKANGEDMNMFMKKLSFESRDNGRTPMQWDASRHGGFTNGTPWLPLPANYKEINAAAQEKNANSVLNHFRQLTALRKNTPALVHGRYSLLLPDHPELYVYTRTWEGKSFLVALNFSAKQVPMPTEGLKLKGAPLVNNYPTLNRKDKNLLMEPYQGIIIALE